MFGIDYSALIQTNLLNLEYSDFFNMHASDLRMYYFTRLFMTNAIKDSPTHLALCKHKLEIKEDVREGKVVAWRERLLLNNIIGIELINPLNRLD